MYFESLKNIGYFTKQSVESFGLPRTGKDLHLTRRRKSFYTIFDKPPRIPYSLSINDDIMESFALDLKDLSNSLPQFTIFRFNLDPHTKLLYPLIEMGLKVNLRYTQVIDLNCSLDNLWKNLDTKRRSEIKLAGTSLQIIESKDIDILENLHVSTLSNKGLSSTAAKTWFHIDRDIVSNNGCKLLYVINEREEILSGGLFIYDDRDAYYLLGGTSELGKRSSASSFLLWKAIEFFSQLGVSRFDFEGSENIGVSKFFEQFGSIATPYWKCEMRKFVNFVR